MARHKPPSQRQLRVGELIRHELAALFLRGDVPDPAIERSGVTVLEVAASPDLKIATAYVRPFGDGDPQVLTAALGRNAKAIRKLLAPRLGLKFMPEIRFKADTSLDYASRIDRLLRDPSVARDLSPRDED